MLEQIIENFSRPAEVAQAPSKPKVMDECVSCGCTSMWLPRGQDQWRCEHCDPPAKEIYVAERRDSSRPMLVSSFVIGYGVPICIECGCRTTLETVWSDGLVEEICESCKGPASWETRPLQAG